MLLANGQEVTGSELKGYLDFYKFVKSKVVIDYETDEVYLPGVLNTKIVLAKSKDRLGKTKGLTSKLLKNLSYVEDEDRFYINRDDRGRVLVYNGYGLGSVGILWNLEVFRGKQQFKLRRDLKGLKYKGTDYPYKKMPVYLLELEARKVAEGLGLDL